MVGEGNHERLTYSVAEAARLLGISRNSAFEAAHTGALPTIRIGRRLLVPRRALERLLDGAGTQGLEPKA